MNQAEAIALAEKVEGLEGADREVEALVWKAIWPDFALPSRMAPYYTESVDRVLALIAEVLPGWHLSALWEAPNHGWSARLTTRKATAHVETDRIGGGALYGEAECKFVRTPAAALLSATLRAIAAEAKPHNTGERP